MTRLLGLPHLTGDTIETLTDIAISLERLGDLARLRGDFGAAQKHFEDVLAMDERIQVVRSINMVTN